jgi:hypothetical protein
MQDKAKSKDGVEGEGSYSGTKAYDEATARFTRAARSTRRRRMPSKPWSRATQRI